MKHCHEERIIQTRRCWHAGRRLTNEQWRGRSKFQARSGADFSVSFQRLQNTAKQVCCTYILGNESCHLWRATRGRFTLARPQGGRQETGKWDPGTMSGTTTLAHPATTARRRFLEFGARNAMRGITRDDWPHWTRPASTVAAHTGRGHQPSLRVAPRSN